MKDPDNLGHNMGIKIIIEIKSVLNSIEYTKEGEGDSGE